MGVPSSLSNSELLRHCSTFTGVDVLKLSVAGKLGAYEKTHTLQSNLQEGLFDEAGARRIPSGCGFPAGRRPAQAQARQTEARRSGPALSEVWPTGSARQDLYPN